jgi:hypothetical protein
MTSESEAQTALSSDDSELLRALGSELTGPQAFPLQPRELAERGTRWLSAQTAYLQQHVCSNSSIRSFATSKEQSDDITIVVELAKLLAGLILPVNPVTLAALLVKRGLNVLCVTQWKTSSAK